MITDPQAALRLARAIASDLSLYNEDKIKEGIEQDAFFETISAEIEEGRSHYNTKVSPDLRATTNFFEEALVDVILKRKSHISSPYW